MAEKKTVKRAKPVKAWAVISKHDEKIHVFRVWETRAEARNSNAWTLGRPSRIARVLITEIPR